MEDTNKCFRDEGALLEHIEDRGKGALPIAHLPCEGYEGMALYLALHFDQNKQHFDLNLEWMSLGLDPYGENWQQSHLYRFPNLDALLAHLEAKYQVKARDIQKHYRFDPAPFPDPFNDSGKAHVFEAAWDRFYQAYQEGTFREKELEIIYSDEGSPFAKPAQRNFQ